MGKVKFIAFFLAVGLFFASCSDEDKDAPVITITSPTAGSQYTVSDTLQLRSMVTEDTKLALINVSSTLGLNTIITTFDTPTSHSHNINLLFDASTPVGLYDLVITATDDSDNTAEEIVQIEVIE